MTMRQLAFLLRFKGIKFVNPFEAGIVRMIIRSIATMSRGVHAFEINRSTNVIHMSHIILTSYIEI